MKKGTLSRVPFVCYLEKLELQTAERNRANSHVMAREIDIVGSLKYNDCRVE